MQRNSKFQTLMFVSPVMLGLLLSGCDEQPPRTHFSVISGTVIACHVDTGELRVRVTAKPPETIPDETIYCVVTRDAEVYINDRLSSINEIRLGDGVELIGYRDPESPIRRLVVSFAYIDHASSPAPKPVLAPAPAATQDAPKSTEIRED